MGDWSKLPYDIIHKVATHIPVIEDFVAFSSVCTSWRSVHLAKQWRPGTNVPVLMFSDDENSSIRSFLSFYSSKVCTSELPEARGKRWWGSSTGWLVTIGDEYEIHLLNPFTHASINLPPHSTLEFRFGDLLNWYETMERAFVFRRPSFSTGDEGLVVVLLFGTMKQIAYCRSGYTSWKCLRSKAHSDIVDVVCVKDQIFALSIVGQLLFVDIEGHSLTSIGPHSPPREIALTLLVGGWDRLSMMESSGKIWLVCHNQPERQVRSAMFMVFSFDFAEMEWTRLKSLGRNTTVFLSDNSCMAVSAVPADYLKNCQGDNIYFVTSKREKGWPERVTGLDAGVHSMLSGFSVPFCSQKCFSFPSWVMPSLQ